jgi:2'-5' RNA ligase
VCAALADQISRATAQALYQDGSDHGARRAHAPTSREARGRFRPHVTLCRTRTARAAPQDALKAADAALHARGKENDRSVSVRSATLYSSTLGPGGPSYAVLDRIGLHGD